MASICVSSQAENASCGYRRLQAGASGDPRYLKRDPACTVVGGLSLPWSIFGDQGVCKDDEFAHDSRERDFRIFSPAHEIPVGQAEGVGVPNAGDGAHIKRIPNLLAASPDHAVSVPGSAVPVQRRDTGKGGDFPGIDLTEFGQIGEQDGRRRAADAGDGSQDIALVFQNRVIGD